MTAETIAAATLKSFKSATETVVRIIDLEGIIASLANPNVSEMQELMLADPAETMKTLAAYMDDPRSGVTSSVLVVRALTAKAPGYTLPIVANLIRSSQGQAFLDLMENQHVNRPQAGFIISTAGVIPSLVTEGHAAGTIGLLKKIQPSQLRMLDPYGDQMQLLVKVCPDALHADLTSIISGMAADRQRRSLELGSEG